MVANPWFASRLALRWLKTYAVLRRSNVIVWQGKIDVAPSGATAQGRMVAQESVAALNWEISFPVDTDVRVADHVVLTDDEYTIPDDPLAFRIVADGGPYTGESVRVAIGLEIGRKRG